MTIKSVKFCNRKRVISDWRANTIILWNYKVTQRKWNGAKPGGEAEGWKQV